MQESSQKYPIKLDYYTSCQHWMWFDRSLQRQQKVQWSFLQKYFWHISRQLDKYCTKRSKIHGTFFNRWWYNLDRWPRRNLWKILPWCSCSTTYLRDIDLGQKNYSSPRFLQKLEEHHQHTTRVYFSSTNAHQHALPVPVNVRLAPSTNVHSN